MKLYIAGPMTGIVNYNLPAFAAAADQLAQAGYEPVNPGSRGVVPGFTWAQYVRRGIRDLMDCDGVALLDGWQTSKGAQFEVLSATTVEIPVLPLTTWLQVRR